MAKGSSRAPLAFDIEQTAAVSGRTAAGRLGLCVSPRHLPPADELAALRPAFLRSILYADRDLDALLATGLSLRLTINNEWARVGSDWSGWEDACRYLRDRAHGRVLSIDCGNELDRWWALREAERQQAPHLPPDVPPDFGAELVTRAQAILNPAGIAVGTSSLGGPRWPEYLAALLQLCRPDHVALNPYGWIFEGIDVKCGAVEALAPGLPYWFPELGCKIVDASGEQGVADALIDVAEVLAARGIDAAWFGWHDLLGTPEERGPAAFGLVDVDGRRRPAWHAFATLNAVATAPEPEPMPDYPQMARSAAAAHSLDPDLFERQIGVESWGFAPDVIECRRDSPAGARGIAQLMPVHWTAVDPCDPEAALDYAAKLLRGHLDYWQGRGYAHPADIALALASYNAGRQATIDGLAGRKPSWPFSETVSYLTRILGVSSAEARTLLVGGTIPMPPAPIKLSDVLARGRSRIGDPYVWDGERPGAFDCSGFVKWCYDSRITSFTDAILGETQRVEQPAPGDIVLYEYTDPSQPGVRFPHVGLFLDDATTLDARYGLGVGEHPQLPRSRATRYYRRAPGAVVDTLSGPATEPPGPLPPAAPAPDPRDERIRGMATAIAHLADVVVPRAAGAAAEREAALAEAQAIREQFVGPRGVMDGERLLAVALVALVAVAVGWLGWLLGMRLAGVL